MITTEITEDEYNRLWATNVAGTFNFSKRMAPLINEGERRYCRPLTAARVLLTGTWRAEHICKRTLLYRPCMHRATPHTRSIRASY